MKLVTLTLSHHGAAHHLPEALGSAPWADEHWVLDTSPDRPEVRQAIDKMGCSNVTVESWPWRNDFSAARNKLFDKANSLASGTDTWAIILDSDERLVVTDVQALRDELASMSVTVCYSPYIDGMYVKDRVFRLPTEARFSGPTHEACCGGGGRAVLQNLKFWELGKSAEELLVKRQRDEKLLRKHTLENPKDPRWFYYLGDTLAALGNNDEAIKAFDRCAQLRGWDEESAWACYRGAEIHMAQERYQDAIDACARGLSRHSGIAELAWIAAVSSYRMGQPGKACYWAKMSIALGRHVGCGDSMTRVGFKYLPALYELPYDVLRFSLVDEASRKEAESEFHKAKMHRFGGTAEQIAISRNVSDGGVRAEARADLGKYATKLESFMQVSIVPIAFMKIMIGDAQYYPMNPSVACVDGKIECIVRTVNYKIGDDGRYILRDEDAGVIKTKNFLVEIDPDNFSVLAHTIKPIVDESERPHVKSLVEGYEDMRLIHVAGKRYASATVRDHRRDMLCEIAICEITDTGRIASVDMQASSGRHEKNWMPIDVGGDLGFVYLCDPTVVRRFNLATRQCDQAVITTPPFALDHLRGGSQAIVVDGSYMCVTHEVVYLQSKRVYLHRFVKLDLEFNVTHVSKVWYLNDLQIEFCAGIGLHKDKLIMSFGVKDHEACLVIVNKNQVMDMLS